MIFTRVLRSQKNHSFFLLSPTSKFKRTLLCKKICFFPLSKLSLFTKPSYYLSQNTSILSFSTKKNTESQLNKTYVGHWLLGCSGLVFLIIILGGLTRLTESGLSITEWKPVKGIFLPLSHDEWVCEFEKYKATPEFKLLNQNISLSDYQFIYKMEWAHRIFGRIIGISFFFPAAYFIIRKKITSNITKRIFVMGGLLGLQGFIGWWMVKSGLEHENFKKADSIPRVSQYRLATHLGIALSLYICMIWTGLDILKEKKWAIQTNETKSFILEKLNSYPFRKLKKMILTLNFLVFITMLSGAFVAGLDAGLIYNTFPYMGKSLVPPKSELFSEAYSHNTSKSDIWWRNMLENPVTVQFNHRILAISTFLLTTATFLYSRRMALLKIVPFESKNTISVLMATVSMQVILGISTLIYLVPIPLAAMHQANSLIVLTSIIIAGNKLYIPKYFLKKYPVKLILNSNFKNDIKS
ncbi:hypothetical protein PORY_000321 [Pneumocystis oryctolagi]|uniref:Uncharacterized protein n=1 Tax=Pneumocystis oryctolagi TaxID=42067 RepID=A0ACB7CGQ4_9ASCO|nr:hypothetical protein PORY_000321 [Pneumocystis oryctolagi]